MELSGSPSLSLSPRLGRSVTFGLWSGNFVETVERIPQWPRPLHPTQMIRNPSALYFVVFISQ
jgi:hypothetical protein